MNTRTRVAGVREAIPGSILIALTAAVLLALCLGMVRRLSVTMPASEVDVRCTHAFASLPFSYPGL